MIRSLFRKKKSSLLSEKFISFLKLQLGIRPVNEKRYLEAITHSSYKNINGNDTDNERLEFLGDAFISMVVADYLFEKYPEQQEGYLTQLRSKIVSRENLNKFGAAIGLEEHLLYQKGKNKYKKFHSMMDCLLYLKAENFALLRKWRLVQEKKLKITNKNKKNLKVMNKQEVLNFMMTYQRITEHMFKTATKYSSIVMSLNGHHQITKLKYNK